MLNGEKAFWKSKGVWAGLVIAALSVYGVEYDDNMVKMVNENIINLTTLISSLVAIYGRIKAKEQVAPIMSQPMVGTVSDYTPSGPSVVHSPAVDGDQITVDALLQKMQMYQVPEVAVAAGDDEVKG